MKRPRQIPGYYTTAQVAKMRDTNHSAAWKWLTRNAGRHFRRVGRLGVIRRSVYHRLALANYVDDKLARLEARMDDAEDANEENSRRIDTLARRVAAMPSR
jgi:hypothetical protein